MRQKTADDLNRLLRKMWHLEGTPILVGPEDKAKAAQLLVIAQTLQSLFRDADVVNNWLREENPHLGGAPLDLIISGEVERVADFVEVMAGRL